MQRVGALWLLLIMYSGGGWLVWAADLGSSSGVEDGADQPPVMTHPKMEFEAFILNLKTSINDTLTPSHGIVIYSITDIDNVI